MSLSQKYQGKVLVPWYNSSEWKYVYDILVTRRECDYQKALEILKIWKIRTPLLSAGVEGTLTILEPLIQSNSDLTDEQIIQIYSISLMRFINLAAANTDRQGFFYKTAAKNELPKWLIDIRHDIAHNNKLPSKSLLELSINQSLDWIVDKYWKTENEQICDYMVTENPKDTIITEYLTMYCQLNLDCIYRKKINAFSDAVFKKMSYYVSKVSKKEIASVSEMLIILEEMIRQTTESVECAKSSDEIMNVLTSQKSLFAVITEENFENWDCLPETFTKVWTNLLNVLIGNGFLYVLIKKLHELTKDLLTSDNIKLASSLWLKEIFQALLKLKVSLEHEVSDSNKTMNELISSIENGFYLDLKLSNSHSVDTKLFEKMVLESPNIYTLKYLVYVLYYKNYSEKDVKLTMDLVKSMMFENIFIFDDKNSINIDGMKEFIETDLVMEFEEVNIVDKPTAIPEKCNSRSKWVVIRDKSIFEHCPLGILPHQDRTKNPCLVLS